MTKKSFFDKFMLLFSQEDEQKNKRISANEAINLQNEYIAATKCLYDAPLTLPYMEIVKQLSSKKAEVYTAALYYLQKIAQNEPEQRNEIKAELQKIAAKRRISEIHRQQIDKVIATIADYK